MAAVLILVAVGFPGIGNAEEPAPPRPDLERLLKLPDSYRYDDPDLRGGVSRNEWQERFRRARGDIEAARSALAESQAELEEVASDAGQWQLAPPGLPQDATDAPLDYRLRQDIKRQREELARAEKGLQDLTIEANLAAVPDAWRE